jgi:hypothetical protein
LIARQGCHFTTGVGKKKRRKKKKNIHPEESTTPKFSYFETQAIFKWASKAGRKGEMASLPLGKGGGGGQGQLAGFIAEAQQLFAETTGGDLKEYMTPPMRTVEDLVSVIIRENDSFSKFRSKRETLCNAILMAMKPIEIFGEAIAGAASELFAPSQNIFSAVMYLIQAAHGVSECYDAITELLGLLKVSLH